MTGCVCTGINTLCEYLYIVWSQWHLSRIRTDCHKSTTRTKTRRIIGPKIWNGVRQNTTMRMEQAVNVPPNPVQGRLANIRPAEYWLQHTTESKTPGKNTVRISFRYWPDGARRRAGSFGNIFIEIYPVRPGILHPEPKKMQFCENLKKMFGNIKIMTTFVSGWGYNPTARAGSRKHINRFLLWLLFTYLPTFPTLGILPKMAFLLYAIILRRLSVVKIIVFILLPKPKNICWLWDIPASN